MPARTADERIERLEDISIERGLAYQAILDFHNLVVKPLVEQVATLEKANAKTNEELAAARGGLTVAMYVGGAVTTVIGLILAWMAVR